MRKIREKTIQSGGKETRLAEGEEEKETIGQARRLESKIK